LGRDKEVGPLEEAFHRRAPLRLLEVDASDFDPFMEARIPGTV
jgi:hypothetical protein